MIARIFRGRVHYGWVVAAATFVVLLTAAGFRATPGVLLLPLQHEFGWSPALIGGAVAVNLLVYGLGAPFAAAIVERFGLRRVTVIALTTVAVGAGLTTQMTSPWQLYLLWGLVVGGATGAVAVPLAAIVANRWFSTRRGLVTGMLTASNASGQLVFLPLLAWVVTAYSWRAAAALIALTAILVVVPIALVFLRTDPADVGLMPYGAVEPEPPRRLVNPFRNAVGALRGRGARARLLAAGGSVLHLRRDDQRPDRDAPDRGLLRPRPERGARRRAAGRDRRVRRGRHHLLGLADRPLRSALAAVLVLRLARHGAAGAERRAVARGPRAWWRSWCSTAWTGWRRCRRPWRWYGRCSAASGWAWCSPGCSRATSSAPPSQPGAPAPAAPGSGRTSRPSWSRARWA